MDLFTHFVFGLLMYVLILKDVTFNYIILALFASILPDLDVFLFPLKRKFKSKYLDHRGGSHSYIVGIIASLIIAFLYALLTHQSFFLS